MTRYRFVVEGVACVALLCAGTVLAAPTAQQKCDGARVKAWRTYVSCVENVHARHAVGSLTSTDVYESSARCRHNYFRQWATLQGAAYTGSTCISNRFTDNGDQTVTDNLSGLTWEKKSDDGSIHDKDNSYTWSTGSPFKESGTAFTGFLGTVNGGGGFGGANGWRLPTVAELQTILLDFACTGAFGGTQCQCGSTPCIEPALDAINTCSTFHWSATTYLGYPQGAWIVDFSDGLVGVGYPKNAPSCVRAVRGGL